MSKYCCAPWSSPGGTLADAEPSASSDEVAAPPGRGAVCTSPMATATAPAGLARFEAGITKLGIDSAKTLFAIVLTPRDLGDTRRDRLITVDAGGTWNDLATTSRFPILPGHLFHNITVSAGKVVPPGHCLYSVDTLLYQSSFTDFKVKERPNIRSRREIVLIVLVLGKPRVVMHSPGSVPMLPHQVGKALVEYGGMKCGNWVAAGSHAGVSCWILFGFFLMDSGSPFPNSVCVCRLS